MKARMRCSWLHSVVIDTQRRLNEIECHQAQPAADILLLPTETGLCSFAERRRRRDVRHRQSLAQPRSAHLSDTGCLWRCHAGAR